MADDEVSMLRGVLSAHRSMLMGALSTNRDLDIDRAFHVHAGLSRILSRWDDYSANEQREIIRTVEYLVNPEDDDVNDLTTPDGFADDLAELRKLQVFLGYV
jgi:hypothetical protein